MVRATLGIGIVLTLALAGAGGGGASAAPPAPRAAEEAAGRLQGLTAAERQQYYHLAEGSELYPLAWMRALKTKEGRPFLEDLGRFGLLEDPDSPLGLPVGMTAQTPRDVRVLGEMVGINCAGCHVGELTRGGKSVRLVGAPNLFDINTFYVKLFEAATITAVEPARRAQFLEDLKKHGDLEVQRATQFLVATLATMEQDQAARLGGAERSFAGRLKALAQKAESGIGQDLQSLGLGSKGRDALRRKLTAGVSDADVAALLDSLKRQDPGGLLKDMAARSQEDIKELVVNAALLRARLSFLKKLKDLHSKEQPTIPGPGRIDAFVNARDLIFPTSEFIPANSPVSYPHIWQLEQTVWLHWDGNTNSVMERNIGQSLGLGAVFDPETLTSTILPKNLYDLELLTRKITPPSWPAAVLGAVDHARSERGKAIYEDRCVKCHAILQGSAKAPDILTPLEEIGTDPNRAINFTRPVGGKNFATSLGDTANAIKKRAYQDNDISAADQETMDRTDEPIEWRTTRSYVGRPLQAIWATAPYLHNGSVPTLHHLLLPAKDRPTTFPVGHREYDPEKLGYVAEVAQVPADQRARIYDYDPETAGRQDFDTTKDGNRNTGHEGHAYGTDLSDEQRKDLLEYLKGL
jgi:hypothetical protein